jgi:hypothetical protein
MQRRMNGRSAPPASADLTQELHDIVESDRYPFSPRIRTLRAVLAKLDPPGAAAGTAAAAECRRSAGCWVRQVATLKARGSREIGENS